MYHALLHRIVLWSAKEGKESILTEGDGGTKEGERCLFNSSPSLEVPAHRGIEKFTDCSLLTEFWESSLFADRIRTRMDFHLSHSSRFYYMSGRFKAPTCFEETL